MFTLEFCNLIEIWIDLKYLSLFQFRYLSELFAAFVVQFDKIPKDIYLNHG